MGQSLTVMTLARNWPKTAKSSCHCSFKLVFMWTTNLFWITSYPLIRFFYQVLPSAHLYWFPNRVPLIVYLCCHILSCVPLLACCYVPLIQLKHFIVSLSQSLDWVPQPQSLLQIVLHYTVNELFQKVHWFMNQWCGASLKTEDVPLHVLCQAVSFTRVVSCRSRFTVGPSLSLSTSESTRTQRR